MISGNKYDYSGADELPLGEVVTCAFAVFDGTKDRVYKNTLFAAIPQTRGEDFDRHLKKRCAEVFGAVGNGSLARGRVYIFREIIQNEDEFDVFYAALGIIDSANLRMICVPLPGFAELADDTVSEYPESAVEAYVLYAAAAETYEKTFDCRAKNFIFRRLLELSEQAPKYYGSCLFSSVLYAPNDTKVDVCVILRSVHIAFDEVFRGTEFSVCLDEKDDVCVPVTNSKYIAAAIVCGVSLLLKVSEKKDVLITASRIKSDKDENFGKISVKLECKDGASAYCLLSYMHADLCFVRCCAEKTDLSFSTGFSGGNAYIDFLITPDDTAFAAKLPFFSGENEDSPSEETEDSPQEASEEEENPSAEEEN